MLINPDSYSFPYDRQYANEFQLIDPSNIKIDYISRTRSKFSPLYNDVFNITNVSPLSIKNDQIVTVSFSCSDYAYGFSDWIGAYPANQDITKIVPLRYSYCNTNASYMQTGSASLTFNFTNVRSDIAFFFMRNQVNSNKTTYNVMHQYPFNVSFQNPNEQLRPRIVATGDTSKFKLLWRLKFIHIAYYNIQYYHILISYPISLHSIPLPHIQLCQQCFTSDEVGLHHRALPQLGEGHYVDPR